ncbi:hypothetical protein D9757_010641 [Collybiopsis confluens]|uniref:Annexin n=1 Tax=Collybiopsis confluens TaxID=2823264 RepID=A0A8H5GMX3_9AGAR|nr:hypothetical protein D9757_010641 [Collybiopsis confluens]
MSYQPNYGSSHGDHGAGAPGGFAGGFPGGPGAFPSAPGGIPGGPGTFSMPEAPGVPAGYGGGASGAGYTHSEYSNERFRDGYNPSYAPPAPAHSYPGQAPGYGVPVPGGGGGYAPPPGPPSTSGYAPPAGPPPPNVHSYPGAPGGQQYGQQQQQQYGQQQQQAFGQQQQQQYGQQQQQPFGQQQQYQNTIQYMNTPVPPLNGPPPTQGLPGYNANADVDKLRNAMKGLGTKESALIQVLTPLSAMHLAVLGATYRASTGKDLLADINSEGGGRLKDVLAALVRGPIGYDVKLLQEALDGAGTDELLLTELIADRSPNDLYYLTQAYRTKYGRGLEEKVRSDLSGKTERIYTMILSSNRPPDGTPVDRALLEADVKALYKAGQGKIGTDEVAFCNIIVNRTTPHLTALWEAYQRQHGKTLSRVIKSEFSGHMKNTLLYIVTAANPKRINEGPGVWRDVKLLEATMKGMGTKDDLLLRRLVRLHWDQNHFAAVKRAYERKYKKSLEARVAGETSGDLKKVCVGIVKGGA